MKWKTLIWHIFINQACKFAEENISFKSAPEIVTLSSLYFDQYFKFLGNDIAYAYKKIKNMEITQKVSEKTIIRY